MDRQLKLSVLYSRAQLVRSGNPSLNQLSASHSHLSTVNSHFLFSENLSVLAHLTVLVHKMPPVANPSLSEAGSSSSSKEMTKQLAWPEAVQLRLKELQESLEDEEITRKGYWKQRFLIVEKLLTKDQLKNVSGLQTDYKAGKVSELTYYDQLKSLLVPLEQLVDEGVENESEAMLWDKKDTAKETKDDVAETENADVPVASSSSSGSTGEKRPKRDRKQPSIQSMFSKASKRKSTAENFSSEKKLKEEAEEGDTKPAVEATTKKSDCVSARCKICRQFEDSPDTLL